MILCIKTDTPVAEVYGYDGSREVARRVWTAHRTLARDLLKICAEVANDAGVSLSTLEGVVVFRGPGSFTGLRIGCMVADVIAYSEGVPIVGVSGDGWIASGCARLGQGEDDDAVLPEYGMPPRVTPPKK